MDKVIQIPYSVDINRFKPLNETEKKISGLKMGLWEDGVIITFVGGINIRKGFIYFWRHI